MAYDGVMVQCRIGFWRWTLKCVDAEVLHATILIGSRVVRFCVGGILEERNTYIQAATNPPFEEKFLGSAYM